jgi:protein TonB
MKTDKILESSFLDLLFENKNKAYGAYELRKNYGLRLKKAVIGTVASVLLIFFILTSFTKKEEVSSRRKIETTILTSPTIQPDKPKDPEKPKDIPKGKPKDEVAINPIYTRPVLEDSPNLPVVNIGAANNPNGSNIPSDGYNGPIGGPTGTSTVTPIDTSSKLVVKTPPIVEEPVIFSSSDAFYAGGKQAFGEYLQNKLGDEAIEEGIVKKITVTFTVEADGSITNISTKGNDDADFINKTIKAFGKMKKWQPAMQNGQAVKSTHEIPIAILPEE